MDPEYDSYGHIMESLFSLSSNYIGCNVEGHTYNIADVLQQLGCSAFS